MQNKITSEKSPSQQPTNTLVPNNAATTTSAIPSSTAAVIDQDQLLFTLFALSDDQLAKLRYRTQHYLPITSNPTKMSAIKTFYALFAPAIAKIAENFTENAANQFLVAHFFGFIFTITDVNKRNLLFAIVIFDPKKIIFFGQKFRTSGVDLALPSPSSELAHFNLWHCVAAFCKTKADITLVEISLAQSADQAAWASVHEFNKRAVAAKTCASLYRNPYTLFQLAATTKHPVTTVTLSQNSGKSLHNLPAAKINLTDLKSDIIHLIFANLSLKDRCAASSTCTSLYQKTAIHKDLHNTIPYNDIISFFFPEHALNFSCSIHPVFQANVRENYFWGCVNLLEHELFAMMKAHHATEVAADNNDIIVAKIFANLFHAITFSETENVIKLTKQLCDPNFPHHNWFSQEFLKNKYFVVMPPLANHPGTELSLWELALLCARSTTLLDVMIDLQGSISVEMLVKLTTFASFLGNLLAFRHMLKHTRNKPQSCIELLSTGIFNFMFYSSSYLKATRSNLNNKAITYEILSLILDWGADLLCFAAENVIDKYDFLKRFPQFSHPTFDEHHKIKTNFPSLACVNFLLYTIATDDIASLNLLLKHKYYSQYYGKVFGASGAMFDSMQHVYQTMGLEGVATSFCDLKCRCYEKDHGRIHQNIFQAICYQQGDGIPCDQDRFDDKSRTLLQAMNYAFFVKRFDMLELILRYYVRYALAEPSVYPHAEEVQNIVGQILRDVAPPGPNSQAPRVDTSPKIM